MKILSTCILLLLTVIVDGQEICDSLEGIGYLKIPSSSKIELLNEDYTVYSTIDPNKSNPAFVKYTTNSLDKATVNVICIRETEKDYYVSFNQEDKVAQIIRKNPGILLVKWEEYILNASIICGQLDVRDTIEGSVEILPKSGLIEPIEMKGDWLLLEWHYYNSEQDIFVIETGWIRWRKDSAILISAGYLR